MPESSLFHATGLHEEKNIDSVIQCLHTIEVPVRMLRQAPTIQKVENTAEQIVDAVSQLVEDIVDFERFIPQKCVSERTVEQIVRVPDAQILEETVAVVKLAHRNESNNGLRSKLWTCLW